MDHHIQKFFTCINCHLREEAVLGEDVGEVVPLVNDFTGDHLPVPLPCDPVLHASMRVLPGALPVPPLQHLELAELSLRYLQCPLLPASAELLVVGHGAKVTSPFFVLSPTQLSDVHAWVKSLYAVVLLHVFLEVKCGFLLHFLDLLYLKDIRITALLHSKLATIFTQ